MNKIKTYWKELDIGKWPLYLNFLLFLIMFGCKLSGQEIEWSLVFLPVYSTIITTFLAECFYHLEMYIMDFIIGFLESRNY